MKVLTLSAFLFVCFTSFNLHALSVENRDFVSLKDTNLIAGEVDGFKTRTRDDKINFGIVMPIMDKADILDFKIASVLSPEVDIIAAIGQQIPVPTNVSMPRQTERYSFFSVTLDKPEYTLYNAQDYTQIGVLEGHFPFTQVVDDFRSGRPLFSLVNDFTFTTYSLSEEFTAIKDNSTKEINLEVGDNKISGETSFLLTKEVPENYVALGMTFDHITSDDGDAPNTRYFATDLKNLKTDKGLNLNSSESSTPIIVMIPKESFESLESSVKNPLPFTLAWNSVTGENLLPILANNVEVTKELLKIKPEDINTSFSVLGYKLSILRKTVDEEGLESETYTQDFEITGLGDLPQSLNVDGHLETEARVRLDVYANKIESEFSATTLEDAKRQATLISRYEIDFK